tara:strand:+ start:999 stop:1634 length:636 start_codon:yes stop_codon:yes gene_type:complete
MWNFKPNENKKIPMNVIVNNKKYIKNHQIINPVIIESLINNNDISDKLINLYNLIPHWVVKADFGRLLYIYYNGGFYSDVDAFIVKSLKIPPNSQNCDMFLFTEKICKSVNELGSRECKNPENVLRISNYFFGTSIKKHPFLKEVINECINRLEQILIIEKNTNLSQTDILWTCGPDVITTIYHKSKSNYNILLFDSSIVKHYCYSSWRYK